MSATNPVSETGGAVWEDGFYEAYIGDVVETYVGPPPDHCVFLVLQRTSGKRLAIKLSPRALDALEASIQGVREHLARKHG